MTSKSMMVNIDRSTIITMLSLQLLLQQKQRMKHQKYELHNYEDYNGEYLNLNSLRIAVTISISISISPCATSCVLVADVLVVPIERLNLILLTHTVDMSADNLMLHYVTLNMIIQP